MVKVKERGLSHNRENARGLGLRVTFPVAQYNGGTKA